MSTTSIEALRKPPRARSNGARPAEPIDRNMVRAIEEAATVGCGCDLRRTMTAQSAYYRAERRGFTPGHELEDWFAAEAEVQSLWAHALEEAPICFDN